MINYYQPFLLPFLRKHTYRLPDHVRQSYFLSFEDALWELLTTRGVPNDSVILVPDFYCLDVVGNIRAHGYRVEYYPMNDQLRTVPAVINQYIRKHKARVLIVFHACGITNMRVTKEFLDRYPHLIVIEDAVQRLVNPEGVRLLSPRHYLIDSLRKVSPIPGSMVYRHVSSPPITKGSPQMGWKYILRTMGYYVHFHVLNACGTILGNARLIIYAHERVLLAHDDIIGNSTRGYGGNPLFRMIHGHFDFETIQRLKVQQITQYVQRARAFIARNPMFYEIHMPRPDRPFAHVFPLGLKHPRLVLMMQYLEHTFHTNGIPVWFKFTDAPWSRKQAVLFLPLGHHVNSRDVRRIFEVLEAAMKAV